jgi:hypothetical protein
MAQGKTWYTIEQANSTFSLETALILKWVEEGAVRAEQPDTRKMQVNVDDLELKIREAVVS